MRLLSLMIVVSLAALPAHAAPSALERAAAQRLGLSRVSLQRLELGAAPHRFTLALDLDGERATVQLSRISLRATPGST